jgi:hypothetical protein
MILRKWARDEKNGGAFFYGCTVLNFNTGQAQGLPLVVIHDHCYSYEYERAVKMRLTR